MVKTRHQVDASESEDDDFVTLPRRRTRRSQNHTPQLNGYDSGEESGAVDNGDEDFDPEVTMKRRSSQTTARTPRAAAAASKERSTATLAAEHDSDGEDLPKKRVGTSPRKVGRPRKVHVTEPDPESSVDEDYDQERERELRRRATRSRRARSPVDAESSVDDEPEAPRSTRRTFKREPEPDHDDERRPGRSRELGSRNRGRSSSGGGDIDGRLQNDSSFEEGRRRSTRTRKLMYDTYDQKLIDRHMALMADDESHYHTRRTRRSNDHIEHEKPVARMKRKREAAMLIENGPNDEDMMEDMYTRVKRVRRQVKRDMYGMPLNEDDDKNTEEEETASSSSPPSSDSSDVDDDDEDNGETKEEKKQLTKSGPRSYYLREHKPSTNRYVAPSIEPKRSLRPRTMFRSTTPPRRRIKRNTYVSPARRKSPGMFRNRKRAAFHGDSSTSSSSSSSGGDSSDDERRFERRKAKSMTKSMNRCLPVNFKKDDLAQSTLRERTRIGSSLADVDPMSVDRSVTFSSVGGLGKHIQQLKEMIVFPLLYPEVFERFHIAPPRGVLFYGPPGTGKTLVARALANECSTADRKVAFFMRKGADCLSKWVGESERQLRLLFDQAYQLRPSIIFFDEIDGLAPVRSSRQDQIHSSIVSTLLALMDGLDSRGEIVIIGATNRIDSIDPALRRPGRFDREFLFPLPSVTARQQILQIQTKEWKPKLCESFLAELGEKTVGYCGADLKSLCTEAALHALRRRYPQIYQTNDKLEIDVQSIEPSARDFQKALAAIVPTGQRSEVAAGRALTATIRPLLISSLENTLNMLSKTFPAALSQHSNVDLPVLNTQNKDAQDNPHSGDHNSADLELYSDDDDDSPPIFEMPAARGRGRKSMDSEIIPRSYFESNSSSFQLPLPHRPRLLLTGTAGQGQSTHIAPAIIHHLERLPVHNLDLPSLYGVSAKTPEEACSQVFREARRTSPSIIYLPHIEEWWDVITDTLRATFITLLNDLPSSSPLLLLATSNLSMPSLPPLISRMFDARLGEVVVMHNPTEAERREFFQDIFSQCKRPPPQRKKAAQRMLEVLPKATAPEPRKLTDTELARLRKQEDATLRELRLFLRDVINKLGRDRKFGIFAKPVDVEEVEDYYEIIKSPMDLSTMMSKIDLHQYQTVSEFLDDIELICNNALEYNPDRAPADRSIRHRACALRDTAQAIMVAELDEGFEKLCEEIKEARAKRGEVKAKNLPNYYFVKPVAPTARKTVTLDENSTDHNQNEQNVKSEGQDNGDADKVTENKEDRDPRYPHLRRIIKRVRVTRPKNKKFQSPWCKPTRKVYRSVVVYIDEHGQEVKPPHEEEDVEDKEQSSDDSGDDRQKDNSKPSESQSNKSPKCSTNEGDKNDTASAKNSHDNKEQSENSKVKDDEDDEADQSPRSSIRTRRRTRSLIESDDEPMDVSKSPPSKSAGTSPARAGNSPARANTPSATVTTRGNPSRTPTATSPGRADVSFAEPVNQAMDTTTTPTRQSPRARRSSVSSHDGKTVADNSEKTVEKSTDSSKEAVSNEKEKEVEATPEKLPCPENSPIAARVTRSHMVQKAVAILEEKLEPMVLDEDRLRYLMAKLVTVTSGYTVEELERIYSRLSQCVYAHRSRYDKTSLIEELDCIIGGLQKH